MDSSIWQIFAAGGLILVVALIVLLAKRHTQKIVRGLINPRPRSFLYGLSGISRQERQQTTAFVMIQVNDLNQLPWGENPVPDRREAEHIYQGALDAIADAEGDYRKLFDSPATYDKVTREDVQKAAALVFQKNHRTVGVLEAKP